MAAESTRTGSTGRMAADMRGGYGQIVTLLTAGLLSGIVSAATEFTSGQLFPGLVFGLLVTGSLALCGRMPRGWRTLWFIAVAGITLPISNMLMGVAQLLLPWHESIVRNTTVESPSPLALFLGGAIGGFLILASALLLFTRERASRALVVAIFWSLIGGVLGIVGWALGPSLGLALWLGLHSLHLTLPGEGLRNALGWTSHTYSILIVWQTGIAVLLGFLLRRRPLGSPLQERT